MTTPPIPTTDASEGGGDHGKTPPEAVRTEPPRPPSREETAKRLQLEVRSARASFASALRAVRDSVEASGLALDAFLSTSPIFDGPAPETLEPGTIAEGAAVFGTAAELIRSLRLEPGCMACEIGPGEGAMTRLLLDRFGPRRLHLFDARAELLTAAVRGDPAVELQDGDSIEGVQRLDDDSLDLAVVDGPASYVGSKRLLGTLLAKMRPGAPLLVRNYTLWSVLGGTAYGIPATVHELANRGSVRIAGFVPQARGYHLILLRKSGVATASGSLGASGTERRSPLAASRFARSPLLAGIAETGVTAPPSTRSDPLATVLLDRIPRGAAVLVAGRADREALDREALDRSDRRTAAFPLDQASESTMHAPDTKRPEASSHVDCAAELVTRLDARIREGWTHLVVPSDAYPSLDRVPTFSAHLRRSYGVVHLDADAVILALREPSPWTALDAFIADFRTRIGRPPAILDWSTGEGLAAAMPELPVFSPEPPNPGIEGNSPASSGADTLLHVDASIDVVAVVGGDPRRTREARRVASAAVVEIIRSLEPASMPLRIEVHRVAEPTPARVAPRSDDAFEPPRLRDRRILICSNFLPQPDCDSYSRRLFHFVEFLRDAGCEVTCVAANPTGFAAFSGLLRERGVEVHLGLEPQRVAALARERRFDWALLGYWSIASSLIGPLRAAAPDVRLIVDSGDLHFLRHARQSIRDGDGLPGRLDAAFARATANEIDVYGAADAVLTVSRKEADLVSDLVGDVGNDAAVTTSADSNGPAASQMRRSHAVPDSEDLSGPSRPLEARRGMVSFGNFGHAPNVEALEHLCRNVLPNLDPALLARHPVFVVGSNVTERVRAIVAGVPGVRLVGWVPSIEPWLESVRLSLIPLLHGAGTKRKMIQALAMGTPTVSTSVGLEGFALEDGRDVLVGDDPVAFASGIARLLSDDGLWRRLSAAGREAMLATHSHAVARTRLFTALEAIRVAPRRRAKTVASSTPTSQATPAGATCPFEGLTSAHVVSRPSPRDASGKPRLSVVIPTRDRAALLGEALESLARQSVDRESFEVVVVNDGSTDATSATCRDFANRLRLVLVDGPAGGIGRAKNVGIEIAQADLVLSFDDDDVADPGLVAAHLAAHAQYPLEHVAILGFTDWHPRLEITELMRYVTGVGHDLFSYTHLRHRQLLDHTWFWGGRSSAKRSLLVRAGGFRTDFTFGSEDIEAGYRISRMIGRERAAAGIRSDEAGLAVVFWRDAVQHANRPMAFDDFCRRCERQGRSQWQYGRFYDDPRVHAWCQLATAEARSAEANELLPERMARVRAVEGLLAHSDDKARGPLRDELHRLYRWTFDACKARGIVEAKRAEGSIG